MWTSVGTASGPVTTLAARMPGTKRRASSSSGRRRRVGMVALVLSDSLIEIDRGRPEGRSHRLLGLFDRLAPRVQARAGVGYGDQPRGLVPANCSAGRA